MNESIVLINIVEKIFTIRGMQVMLDRDLAELYQVETKRLNEQVKRNIERFPQEFMFQLTKNELENWKSQFATSNQEIMGLRKMPFAFTEQGVSMLSAVLKSEIAIKTSIQRRILIIDGKELYHIGASLKDLGKKWFAFSKFEMENFDILMRLEG